ncbi:MAG: PAS domain S-box protein [Bacteroidia bacterium]
MKNALKISLIYLVFGVTWILLSDDLTFYLFRDNMVVLENVQHLKGVSFVLISAILVFLLTNTVIQALTKQKLIEVKAIEDLGKSEKKFRLLFHRTPLPVLIFDKEHMRFLEVNETATKKYGYSRDEFLAMEIWDIFKPEARTENMKAFFLENIHAIEKGDYAENISIHRTKKGSFFEVKVVSYSQSYLGKPVVFSSVLDISQEKVTEQRIINEVIKATEEDREQISMEIHDNLIQILGMASMYLKNLVYDIDELKTSTKYQHALKHLNTGIDLSRSISHKLMPKSILDFGLIPGITEMIEEFQVLYPISVNFTYEGEAELSQEFTINIFRIVQEALNNVQKHAEASNVDIRLFLVKPDIKMEIIDNGKGFKETEVAHLTQGIGLRIMHNRALQMNGFFSIHSKINEGTSLKFIIPI